jgi:hypothetical protein
MEYILVNAAILLLVVVFQVVTLDAYIKKLVDKAIDERCGNCEFKKSKSPSSGLLSESED